MAPHYTVRLKRSAERELRRLPRDNIPRILSRMQQLASQPRPPGCKKLTGEEEYRVRQGDFRFLYTVDDQQRLVEVVKIAHRREVCR